jgi:hypothetical protein
MGSLFFGQMTAMANWISTTRHVVRLPLCQQALGRDVRVPLQRLPLFVPRHQRDLWYLPPLIEQAADVLVAQVMEPERAEHTLGEERRDADVEQCQRVSSSSDVVGPPLRHRT